MNGLILGTMVALSAGFQQTDTTFAVEGAERLSVETLGGSIEVGVWDEERIRVQAEHSNRTFVQIERGRRGIRVESEARRGPANLVDFRILVPRRMTLDLEAQYGDIVIDGSDGEVQAETLQGDVTIMGGRGSIQVESTMGAILVDGAEGRIELESSGADIRVVNSTGEIYAETAGGTIVLQDVSPSVVDVGSTGGRVHYDGSFEPGGTYFFGAHGGSITIVVPDGASASFNVATVHGSISSNLRGEAESLSSGERHEFEIGGGGALVEAETYGGRIRLLRRGTEGSEAPAIRRNRIRDEADWTAWAPDRAEPARWLAVSGVGSIIAARVAAEVGPRLSAEISPRVTAEVTPRVTAEVTPRVTAEVTPRVTAEVTRRVTAEVTPRVSAEVAAVLDVAVAPRVEVEVARMLDARFERGARSAPKPEPATIRR